MLCWARWASQKSADKEWYSWDMWCPKLRCNQRRTQSRLWSVCRRVKMWWLWRARCQTVRARLSLARMLVKETLNRRGSSRNQRRLSTLFHCDDRCARIDRRMISLWWVWSAFARACRCSCTFSRIAFSIGIWMWSRKLLGSFFSSAFREVRLCLGLNCLAFSLLLLEVGKSSQSGWCFESSSCDLSSSGALS